MNRSITFVLVLFSFIQKKILNFSRLSYEKPNGRHNIGIGAETKLELMNNKERKCNFNAKFREPDGTCNNRRFPFKYGVAYTPFRR